MTAPEPSLRDGAAQFPGDGAILIAGPTASGKSALALRLAERLDGCVINADALQVYAEWRVLTARPGVAETARAPHRLYGHVSVKESYSVGRWLGEVADVLADCRARRLRPIIVGGTGLYLTALTEGLAEIAPPSPAVRAAALSRLATLGREGLAAEIGARDPATAARIDLANPARLLRAWEALADGEGLFARWARTPPPLVPPTSAVSLALVPDRAALGARCDARFDAMLAEGALAEVATVAALGLPATAPAMKAVGAAALMAHLRGEIALETAAAQAKQLTRAYAKRQTTWIRNRLGGWRRLDAAAAAALLR